MESVLVAVSCVTTEVSLSVKSNGRGLTSGSSSRDKVLGKKNVDLKIEYS